MRSRLSLLLVLALATVGVPSPVAAAMQLPLSLVALTSPVTRGHDARVTVQTAPHTQCMLLVHYKSASTTVNLAVPKRSDNRGQVSWTWRVTPDVTPGTWPLTVHCSDESHGNVIQTRLDLPFVVR